MPKNIEQDFSRSRIWITYKGERKPLIDWCDFLELPYHVLYQRVIRNGWSIQDAFETPYQPLAHRELSD